MWSTKQEHLIVGSEAGDFLLFSVNNKNVRLYMRERMTAIANKRKGRVEHFLQTGS